MGNHQFFLPRAKYALYAHSAAALVRWTHGPLLTPYLPFLRLLTGIALSNQTLQPLHIRIAPWRVGDQVIQLVRPRLPRIPVFRTHHLLLFFALPRKALQQEQSAWAKAFLRCQRSLVLRRQSLSLAGRVGPRPFALWSPVTRGMTRADSLAHQCGQGKVLRSGAP